jgi:hypothetical protein
VAEGRHEAIIDQEEFDAVQKKLGKSRKSTLTRNGNQDYLLIGLLVCTHHCGHRLQGYLNCAIRKNKRTKTKLNITDAPAGRCIILNAIISI